MKYKILRKKYYSYIKVKFSSFDPKVIKKVKSILKNKYVFYFYVHTNIHSLIKSPHIFNKSHTQLNRIEYRLYITFIQFHIRKLKQSKKVLNYFSKVLSLVDITPKVKFKTTL